MSTDVRKMRTTKEASHFLGLSESTLNKMRLTGAGPAYRKFGRVVRYDPLDLEEYATARKRISTSQAAA